MSDIIVSGMRPTGSLHVGHYAGVIKNWVALQKDYECFYFLADWHAVTSSFDNLEVIKKSRYEYLKGWMASGLDPDKVTIYNQSDHPEILYLNQLFLAITPPGWADRSPSWKDLKENPNKKLDNLGFYTYPILQAADISILKGKWVPVGEDQVSHVEISREIIRKFNRLYKTNLPIPEAKLTKESRISGIDGHGKMSSSKGNVISLQETEKSLQKKVNKMKTDDQRGGVENPGNPENCTVFEYHKAFSCIELKDDVDLQCRAAAISCGECKKKLGDSMKQELIPIADKIAKISDSDCDEVLAAGNINVAKKMKENWSALRTKIGF